MALRVGQKGKREALCPRLPAVARGKETRSKLQLEQFETSALRLHLLCGLALGGPLVCWIFRETKRNTIFDLGDCITKKTNKQPAMRPLHVRLLCALVETSCSGFFVCVCVLLRVVFVSVVFRMRCVFCACKAQCCCCR